MAVVIETTIGDITVDLFTEKRPQTCKNFLKLCKIKYYNLCLFHSVQANFIAQTGDPTGSGTGGESVFGVVHGNEKKYYEAEKVPRIKHDKPGLLSMVNCGSSMLGSQFFLTLGTDLPSLDEHCVFAEVTEGLEILVKLNDAICDHQHRPYQDIRITHTVVLEDPYEDLPGLVVPDASPDRSTLDTSVIRIGADEKINDEEGLTEVQLEELKADREAKARATILEIVGDLPDADFAPPENVLFVCKLNPVTTDEDLEIIFSRFGKVKCCEVIRDHASGDSLQYAFVEFEDQRSCEQAFLKMDNVLIDDRRIHVDFSQSVSKIRWKGKGRGVQYMDRDGKNPTANGNQVPKRDTKERDRGDRDRDRKTREEEDRDRDRRRDEDRRRRGDRDGEDLRRRERRKDDGRRREEEATSWRTEEDRRRGANSTAPDDERRRSGMDDERFEEDRKRRERDERRREEERRYGSGRREDRRRDEERSRRRETTDKRTNGERVRGGSKLNEKSADSSSRGLEDPRRAVSRNSKSELNKPRNELANKQEKVSSSGSVVKENLNSSESSQTATSVSEPVPIKTSNDSDKKIVQDSNSKPEMEIEKEKPEDVPVRRLNNNERTSDEHSCEPRPLEVSTAEYKPYEKLQVKRVDSVDKELSRKGSIDKSKKKKRKKIVSSSSSSSSSDSSDSSSSDSSPERRKKKRSLTVAKKYYHRGKLVKIVKKKRKHESSESETFSESSDSDKKKKKPKYKKVVKVIKKLKRRSSDDSDSSSSDDSDDSTIKRRKRKEDKRSKKKRKTSSKKCKKKRNQQVSEEESSTSDNEDYRKLKESSKTYKLDRISD